MQWQQLIYLLFGVLGLWLGSEITIRSVSQISKKAKISETLLGLIFLGLGTQLPLIITSVQTSFKLMQGAETSELVVGNIVAANVTLITLVLGLAGLITNLKLRKSEIAKNGLILTASTLLVLLLAGDGFISPADGLVMLLFYVVYLFWLPTLSGIFEYKIRPKKVLRPGVGIAFLRLIISFFVIYFSANWVVAGSTAIAKNFEVNHLLIKLLLMGVGTTLPSLAVSLNAAGKGKTGLVIGNVIGSSMCSLLAGLGSSALLIGWTVDRGIASFDLVYLLFTVVVVVLFLLTRNKFERKESALILALYGIYLSLKIFGF